MSDQQPPQSPTPERLTDILKLLLERSEPIIKLWTTVAEGKLTRSAALAELNAASVRTHVMSRCCVSAPAHYAHRWPNSGG